MVGQGLEIFMGSSLFEKLSQPQFLADWYKLYESCPWATAGQHPGFVTSWCRTYGLEQQPLLVLQHDSAGQLNGVAALQKLGTTVQHLGADDCEYHPWIASPDQGDSFMPAAILALDQLLGTHWLKLRYLPPNTPRNWLKLTTQTAARCEESLTERRVLRVSDPEFVQKYVRDKARLRTTMNKFKRSGNIRFRRVVDPEEIARVITECEPMFDFRKGAAYGLLPFRDDPKRKPFLITQAAVPGLLHVSVLERDGAIVAAHVGPTSKTELSIAGLVHNDFESRHSPGSLLLLELIQLLHREGFETLDFTPGDNEYKTRFATETEPVYSLTVHPSRIHRQARRTKVLLKQLALHSLTHLPEQVQRQVRQIPKDFKNVLQTLRHRPQSKAFSKSATTANVTLRYAGLLNLPAPPIPPLFSWSSNCLGAMVQYPGDRDQYLGFLRNTLTHVRVGASLHTLCRNGRLRSYCYVTPARAFHCYPALEGDAWVLADYTQLDGSVPFEEQQHELVVLLHSLPLAIRARLFASVDRTTEHLLKTAGFETPETGITLTLHLAQKSETAHPVE